MFSGLVGSMSRSCCTHGKVGRLPEALLATPEDVQQAIQARLDVGMDEVIAWPCIPELDQVDRLAEIVSRLSNLHTAPA